VARRDHAPAFGENGTFSGFLYAAEAVRVVAVEGYVRSSLSKTATEYDRKYGMKGMRWAAK
jgi:hypothetical protein